MTLRFFVFNFSARIYGVIAGVFEFIDEGKQRECRGECAAGFTSSPLSLKEVKRFRVIC